MIVKLHKNRAECALRLGESDGAPSAVYFKISPPGPRFKSDTERPMVPSDFGARFDRAEIAPVHSSAWFSEAATPRFSRNYSTPSTIRKSRTAPSPGAFKASAYAALS
jgi:hypothetical protein